MQMITALDVFLLDPYIGRKNLNNIMINPNWVN